MGTNRRMSICMEDTKSNAFGRKILASAEWASLFAVLSAWAYFMYEVLRPNATNHINLFGITFYKGPAFDNFCFNAIIYFNFYGVLHVIFMLLSKHSNRARAICGYNSVDSRQSFQMTILTAIYFNAILSSSAGLGDNYACGCVTVALTTLQALSFYFLIGQYMFSLFFRHTMIQT